MTDLPTGIGAPALSALDHAGVSTLEGLAAWTESGVLALHGVGPKALRLLHDELAQQELGFSKELTTRQVAEAFSGHRFDLTIPYLADDIRWNLVGQELLGGKAAVIAACRRSAAELAGVTTTFDKFRSIVAEDCVVIDSLGRYTDPAGVTSVVASCDIYDFVRGTLTAITSYATELTGPAPEAT